MRGHWGRPRPSPLNPQALPQPSLSPSPMEPPPWDLPSRMSKVSELATTWNARGVESQFGKAPPPLPSSDCGEGAPPATLQRDAEEHLCKGHSSAVSRLESGELRDGDRVEGGPGTAGACLGLGWGTAPSIRMASPVLQSPQVGSLYLFLWPRPPPLPAQGRDRDHCPEERMGHSQGPQDMRKHSGPAGVQSPLLPPRKGPCSFPCWPQAPKRTAFLGTAQ